MYNMLQDLLSVVLRCVRDISSHMKHSECFWRKHHLVQGTSQWSSKITEKGFIEFLVDNQRNKRLFWWITFFCVMWHRSQSSHISPHKWYSVAPDLPTYCLIKLSICKQLRLIIFSIPLSSSLLSLRCVEQQNAVARLGPTQSHRTQGIDWLSWVPAKLDAVLHHALQLAVLD